MVRCKFKCVSKLQKESGYEIALEPVTCGSEENANFFNYTPYGGIHFGTINESAAQQYVVGKTYYIDMSVAE